MKQCMYREVKEEIGIDIDSSDVNPHCLWLRDGTKSERHIAIVFVLERDIEEVKIVIDDDEFVRWQKKGTPGTGDIIDEKGLEENIDLLDTWSKNIVSNIVKINTKKERAAKNQEEFKL